MGAGTYQVGSHRVCLVIPGKGQKLKIKKKSLLRADRVPHFKLRQDAPAGFWFWFTKEILTQRELGQVDGNSSNHGSPYKRYHCHANLGTAEQGAQLRPSLRSP